MKSKKGFNGAAMVGVMVDQKQDFGGSWNGTVSFLFPLLLSLSRVDFYPMWAPFSDGQV